MNGALMSIKRLLRNQDCVKHIKIKKNKIIVRDGSSVLKVNNAKCMEGLLALIDVVGVNHCVSIECDKGTYCLRVAEVSSCNDDTIDWEV